MESEAGLVEESNSDGLEKINANDDNDNDAESGEDQNIEEGEIDQEDDTEKTDEDDSEKEGMEDENMEIDDEEPSPKVEDNVSDDGGNPVEEEEPETPTDDVTEDAEGAEEASDEDDVVDEEKPHEESEDEDESGEHPVNDNEDSEDQETNNNEMESLAEQQDIATNVLPRKRSASSSSADDGPKRKQGRSGSMGSPKHDSYCWICHREAVTLQSYCKTCPRTYHFNCLLTQFKDGHKARKALDSKTCTCPECELSMQAENLETRSDAMKQLTVDQLIMMLKNACQRMKNTPGAEPFLYPVDPEEAVDYFKYVVCPMDLTTLEKNVKERMYGSTEAFYSDAQWLVHNSVIFNSASSAFTVAARRILKTCKQEIQEIETCPECYVNAHNKPDCWFIEACKRPHIIVWAKLKGFPFWPAKAMKMKDEMVDVRFFGQHDRAWVCWKDCYLYSEEMPGAPPKRNTQLLAAIQELNAHVDRLKEISGPFLYSPVKCHLGNEINLEEIRKQLPEYTPDTSNTKTPAFKTKMALQSSEGKSPVTIRISSLKTNPTIVTNSVAEESNSMRTSRTKKAPSSNLSNAGSSSDESPKKLETTNPKASEHPETPVSKGSEILASALGLSRVPRRNSRPVVISSPSNHPKVEEHNGEQQTIERARLSEDSNEDKSSDPPPPDAFLQSIGLRKAGDSKTAEQGMTEKVGKVPVDRPIKDEPEETCEEDQEADMQDADVPMKTGGMGVKAQDLMNQMSGSSKTGMRFNLSKDISISPVDEDGEKMATPKPDMRNRQRLMNQGASRVPPGLIPHSVHMQMGNKPRMMGNGNPGMNCRPMGQQVRMMSRPVRPGGAPRPGGIKLNRPPNSQHAMGSRAPMMSQKQRDSTVPLVVESSSLRLDGHPSSGSSNQLNQVQSLQGAITLPGGTITVTPLAPLIGVPITTYSSSGESPVNGGSGGSVVTIKSNTAAGIGLIQHNIAATNVTSANGLPISIISPQDGNPKSKHTSQQRRNLMNQIPPAVGHMVQTLQKNLIELVKTSMEQIVIEIVENYPGMAGGAEVKSLKQENEKLQKQLIDSKHNFDVSVREVKMALDTDKKRAMNELRRQLEHDKLKAIEEVKKKQWCARCGREAQFYCCWNTSYCGYECQEDHWPLHMASCSQSSSGGGAR